MKNTDDKLVFNQELDDVMANTDFANAKPVSQIPALAKRQALLKTKTAHTQSEIDLIAPDVWQLIRQKAHDSKEIGRMNGVLRSLLA